MTIVIPCRNEEEFIGKCLDSVTSQDFPKERMEVFVIDGMSEDRTREIVNGFASRHSYIELHENPGKTIPSAMNIGIMHSSADVVMKIDGHTLYEPDYVSKCLSYLRRSGADNVGGLVTCVPRRNTLVGRAIVASLSHIFGIGNAGHRLLPREAKWADTAYSGCYRKKVFERVGLYNENISRSEDVAMNSKIRKAGGKILLVPEIRSRYFARSTLKEFIRHNFDNGYWITFPLAFRTWLFSFRHIVPLLFLLGVGGTTAAWMLMQLAGMEGASFRWGLTVLVAVLGLYALSSFIASVHVAVKERDARYLVVMPMTFACLHFFYGVGSMWGLFKAAAVWIKRCLQALRA